MQMKIHGKLSKNLLKITFSFGSSLTTDLRQIFSGMCGAGRIFCYWKIKILTVPCLVQDLEKIFFKIETMEVCYQSNNSSLGLAKSIVSTFVYFQIWARSGSKQK